MAKADAPVEITGRVAVVVSKYTGFDLSAPEKTQPHEFSFINPSYVNDGVLDGFWSKDGYRFVGWAAVSIQVLPVKSMLQSAVEGLKAEKQKVLADAEREATRLESEIQKLLAITYDVEA